MMHEKPIRVMWLLNHTTLRNFELNQFAAMGITEVFLPKSFPYDESNFSASIDLSKDASLTIPAAELAILNAQNWYENPEEEAWRIANEYFDIAIIGFFPKQIESTSRSFLGAIVLRAFGLASYTYTQLLYDTIGACGVNRLMKAKKRFWFAAGYEHLQEIEGEFLRSRACYLPVGLQNTTVENNWTGRDKRILFVCPRIKTSGYYKKIYEEFIQNFSQFEYTIGGAQPITVSDPNVIGFVTSDQHHENMRNHKLMFYHSVEKNHIHYHPFEAIRKGMPLLFMAGGMLDRLGGKNLPGRCLTIKEAQNKVAKIFNDDVSLIKRILSTQEVLLNSMKPENCIESFHTSITAILKELSLSRQTLPPLKPKKRIAIILPISYSGGTLRGTKLLAEALLIGSQKYGEEVEVVLAHPEDPELYQDAVFNDLPITISRRSFVWNIYYPDRASRAMTYAGHPDWKATENAYIVPNDGINHLLDCDLWIIISDRLNYPLLPLRENVVVVYDYIQRYVPFLPSTADLSFLKTAREAKRVLVTTHFTAEDALQYGGIHPEQLCIVPPLVPKMSVQSLSQLKTEVQRPYFIWTTNVAQHKNHLNAFKSLHLYYEKLGGDLECHITGCDTHKLLDNSFAHLREVQQIYLLSKKMQRKVKLFGELSETIYQHKLKQATFLWHAALIDNGTFSVIEAAQLGVPALSTDYPAMREIDGIFKINLTWMDAENPEHMAAQLKWMQDKHSEVRSLLSTNTAIEENSLRNLSHQYWKVVRECL